MHYDRSVPASIRKLVLLPGTDGTGDLFKWFIEVLPAEFEATVVRYPSDAFLSYEELGDIVRDAFPERDPFVLIAESFSTPVAIECAALNSPNLKGLILCAGFATSPLHGLRRTVCSLLPPFVFGARLPASLVRFILVGRSAPPYLVEAVQDAIHSVQARVLLARLRMILGCDVRAMLGEVSVPIFYVRAMQDKLVPAQSLAEILKIKPEATVASIPGPHLLFQCEPNRTAKAVEGFVCGLDR